MKQRPTHIGKLIGSGADHFENSLGCWFYGGSSITESVEALSLFLDWQMLWKLNRE